MTVDLNTLRTPGPTITKTTSSFWEAAENGQLVLQYCEVCNNSIFYPRTICPICWSHELIWKQASGNGILKSFSVIHKPGHPAWMPVIPYVVGLVELEEGPTMLSFIIIDPDYLCAVGQSLKLSPTNISGRVLPVFKPL